MVIPPGEVLKKARSCVKEGEHAEALANYELFFDRALQDQGEDHNYYGVRLSYCLDEWARLGVKYPSAKQRLEAKAVEALAAFEATKDEEKFHDFQSISDYLDQRDRVLGQFIVYHQANPALAEVAVRFMWNRLVDAKRWDICAVYLGDLEAKYESALHKFDHSMEICLADPSLGGAEFSEQIKGWYVREVGNLIRALKNTDQEEAAARLIAAVVSDMNSRGHPEVVDQVNEQATL